MPKNARVCSLLDTSLSPLDRARLAGQKLGVRVMHGELLPPEAARLLVGEFFKSPHGLTVAALELACWLPEPVEVDFRIALNHLLFP